MLDELRALHARATPGPWGTQPCSHGGLIVTRGPGDSAPLKKRHPQSHLQVVPEADAAIVVAAVNALPALVAVAEAAHVVTVDVVAAAGHRLTMNERDALRALAATLSALRGAGEAKPPPGAAS